MARHHSKNDFQKHILILEMTLKTDYLFDIPVGAVAGISQAVKGLLQLGVMPIDYRSR